MLIVERFKSWATGSNPRTRQDQEQDRPVSRIYEQDRFTRSPSLAAIISNNGGAMRN